MTSDESQVASPSARSSAEAEGQPKSSSGEETLSFRTSIDVPAAELFAWHEHPGAVNRLIPPWQTIELEKVEGIRDGDQTVMQVAVGPFMKKWVAEHRDYVQGEQFRDVQVKGPFSSWIHTHRMEADGPETSYLNDQIAYRLPLGALGRKLAGTAVRKRIKRQLAYRHRITQNDVLAHHRYAPDKKLRIAISGAYSLIGSHLAPYLEAGGHEVIPLVNTRKEKEEHDEAIYWNYQERSIESEKLEGLDVVIHLAGEHVGAFRWNERTKMNVYTSRVRGTQLISEALADLQDPPDVFLCASDTGIYGDRGDAVLTEESATGEAGFLTAVCRDWEIATQPARKSGIRTVSMRIGVVLTPDGGLIEFIKPHFNLGLGGRIGSPNQYVSWIALDDLLQSIYHLAVNDEAEGPVNLTAPQPATTATFARTLAKVLSRPAFLNLSNRIVKLLLGDAAEEFVLKSARVHPERLEKTSYNFLYPDLEGALRHQLGKTLTS